MLTKIRAYAIDCTIDGELEMAGERLRDQLNRQEQVVLLKATLTRLTDGSRLTLPEVVLDQEELLAVEGPPTRKPDPESPGGSRRLHTVRHRRRARLGPYSILGSIHERPGVAPLGGMRLTSPFVAFTEARIAYQRGESAELRDVGSLIVNGRQIAWLGEAAATSSDPPVEDATMLALLEPI